MVTVEWSAYKFCHECVGCFAGLIVMCLTDVLNLQGSQYLSAVYWALGVNPGLSGQMVVPVYFSQGCEARRMSCFVSMSSGMIIKCVVFMVFIFG